MATPDALAEPADALDDGKPAPPHRLTLLSLPDELLSQIFRQVHAMYMHKKRNMPPTSYLCLNKRLSTLAQPIWLSVLCAPQDKAKAERFFLGMIGMQDRLLHVRELEWNVHKSYPAYRIALVKSLRNLDTLRLRAMNALAGPVDEGVWSTIANWKKLKDLVFLSATTPLDRSYYPNLHVTRIECTPSDLSAHAMFYRHLRLRLHRDEAVPCLPLATVRSLEIVLDESIESNPSNFVASLLLQIDQSSADEPCPSLTRLSLAFKHIAVWPQTWHALSVCCRSTALSALELRLPPDFDLEDLDFNAWPNLRQVTLVYRDPSAASLASLCDFAMNFSRLKLFKLVGFDWPGNRSTEVLPWKPESLYDYVDVPRLYSFLNILREQTDVLDLCLRSDEDINTPEYRWTRQTSQDNFDVDSYALA